MNTRVKVQGGHMPAPKGNQFWRARSKHGRDKIFKTPADLWEACCEYFDWVEENPLHEAQAFAFQGNVTEHALPKMRAMTIQGLCLFLDNHAEAFCPTFCIMHQRRDVVRTALCASSYNLAVHFLHSLV